MGFFLWLLRSALGGSDAAELHEREEEEADDDDDDDDDDEGGL
jgi:hypothetical protein